MTTSDAIKKLQAQSRDAAIRLSSIGRGMRFMRDASGGINGKKMTEAQAHHAFNFICDALGLDPAETGERLIEHFVSASRQSTSVEDSAK